MRGPADDEWERMTQEQRHSYFTFGGVVLVIVAVFILEKIFN